MAVKRVRFEFKVSAPDAKEVMLAGTFNDWSRSSDPMKKDKTGTWKKIKMLPQGTHEYKYVVDGIWMLDRENPRTALNQYGTRNNVVEVRKAVSQSK
jgi:1,4-alpha-glucan branching enzyme